MTDNNNNTEGQKPSALTESAKPSILDFGQPDKEQSIIKVIGVGGGGGNAVNHMYREGIHDVSFVLCNTDAQALNDSPVPEHLQLGAEGLGAGNRPERARQAAMESIDQIRAMLNDGTKMAFITAGMGGGTGTGAAPVIAQVSKEMGILTVGIVTIPFRFEGPKKIDQALDGVEEMAKHVDALLVINNERLREIYPELTVLDAFGKADDTLSVAAKSIAEIITIHGLINLDFNDVKTVLKDGGVAIMSTGYGEGDGRVKKAIDDALNSPLLNDNDVFNSKKILLSIAFSNEKNDNQGLMMEEMNDVNDFMAKFGDDFEIKWGLATDPELGKKVKVTILATGFGVEDVEPKDRRERRTQEEANRIAQEEEIAAEKADRRNRYYGKDGKNPMMKHRPHVYIFTPDTLDNEDVGRYRARHHQLCIRQRRPMPSKTRIYKQQRDMANLFEQVSSDIRTAMKARDKVRLEALRNIKKCFIEAKTAPGANDTLEDAAALKILQKLAKQGEESADTYAKAKRQDLADAELAQVAVIKEYLPKPLSEEEITAQVKDIIAQTGAQGMKDMGKVMGQATKQMAGKADGKVISTIVRQLLA